MTSVSAFAAGLLFNTIDIPAAQNPFIASENSKSTPSKNRAIGYPAFLKPLMKKIGIIQQGLKQEMVRIARDIRDRPFERPFWSFMLLSFLYGVIHALGPGHGKIYTCSYFLSRPGTLKKVLLFGNLTMFVHVLSGTFLILFGAFVLRTSGAMTLENSSIVLERFSYAGLVGVGLFILGKIILEMKSGDGHHHGCPDKAEPKSMMITALVVGIVPCPGAALILLFSLTLGILSAGLWAMICIAAGMAITSCVFAFGAIVFRRTFLTLAQGNDRIATGIYNLFSMGGALCISSFGLLLLLGTF